MIGTKLGLSLLGLFVVACAAETAESTPSTGEESSSTSAAVCAAKRAEQTELLAASRSCSADADCTEVVAFCNFEHRVDCTGVFYVSRDIDMDAFNRLEEELNQCTPQDDCGTCLMGWAKPACVGGLCVKGSEPSE